MDFLTWSFFYTHPKDSPLRSLFSHFTNGGNPKGTPAKRPFCPPPKAPPCDTFPPPNTPHSSKRHLSPNFPQIISQLTNKRSSPGSSMRQLPKLFRVSVTVKWPAAPHRLLPLPNIMFFIERLLSACPQQQYSPAGSTPLLLQSTQPPKKPHPPPPLSPNFKTSANNVPRPKLPGFFCFGSQQNTLLPPPL